VAACGIVGGTQIPVDIFPFILRDVNLLGVASADASLEDRKRVFSKFVTLWKLAKLESMCDEITLDDLSDRVDQMLSGNITRRALVKVS
jgi:D-arabinose 1-dehydrogenase-like Zn-dependent alcohol dehydrogenase